MTKAKMDYLWAPKSEGVVSDILNHIGIEKVGTSARYPTGVKYDTLIAISDVLHNNDKFASMVASATHNYQADPLLELGREGYIEWFRGYMRLRLAGLLERTFDI